MSPHNRWLFFFAHVAVVCTVLTAGLAGGVAVAQPAPPPDPSPFAPGDLKRPIFDTKTPVYDMADKQAKSADAVVAEVDGRPITLGDVADAIRGLPPTVARLSFDELYPGILAQLIREQALVVRAHHQGLDDDPAVRRKVKAASDRVLANEMLTQEADRSVTEAALLERYNKEIAGKPGPDEVHVRVIMVATEQEAMDIIGELRGGADFAALAKRSSKDPTASSGGDAGFATRDRLTPEIGAVVFSMQPGQFTPFPINTGGAWFVLKVEERRHQPTRAFSVEREGLRQAMLREKARDVAAAAERDVTVREFDISGKEADSSAVGAGARAAQ